VPQARPSSQSKPLIPRKHSRSDGASSPGAQAAAGVGTPWLLAGAAVTAVVLVLALIYSGAAAAGTVSDPGALTRWGLPVAEAVHNLAAATVIGSLVFAAVILPRQLRPRRARGGAQPDPADEHPAFAHALQLAAWASIAWTLAAVAVLVLTFSDISGLPLSGDAQYTSALVGFVTDIPNGRAWLATSVIAAVVSTLTFGVRSTTGLALTMLLAIGGLIPMALVGHAAGADDHYGAVNSIGLHLVGVALWIGGLIVLAFVSRDLTVPASPGRGGGRDDTAAVLARYSALALFAFALVLLSGVVNAAYRINSWSQLFSSEYGTLALVKTAATLLLGAIGWMHRRWIIPQLGTGTSGGGAGTGVVLSAKRVLWQLVAVELLIMGAVSAVAVVLSRTPPPVPELPPVEATPARLLTGYELPPELTSERYLTEWRFDWLWVAVALTLTVAYVLGVIKLHRRGDSWPVLRILSWFVGMVLLTYFTSGAPAVYGMVLFSAHMLDHMALTMVVPLFLVLGAPLTLALKALTPRGDGSRGLREWILILIHSKFSQLVTHPLFAAANFAGSIILFYYSPLFGLALREHVGHELMNVHFLLTGYIFALTMVGVDPLPRRAPYPLRLVLLLATMAFHAFFAVSIMGGDSLIQASWFGNMGRDWGLSAIEDQQLGGAYMWGIGEIPTVLLAIIVAVTWSRTDARETKRKDRAADRNNDAELAAYNDMFAKLAERDRDVRR
jgi:cytochrome c oxidase assembly factor CtaG/putative copper export protein